MSMSMLMYDTFRTGRGREEEEEEERERVSLK